MKNRIKSTAIASLACVLSPFTSFSAITIDVDEFNADILTVTVNGGSGNAITGAVPGQELDILDFAPGPGTFWINSGTFTPIPASVASLPATSEGNTVKSLAIYNDAAGDTVYINMENNLSVGEYFLSSFTVSWSGTGLFSPAGVGSDPLVVYWGTNASLDAASGTFQDSTPVPEPKVFAVIAGLAGIAFVVKRRSKKFNLSTKEVTEA